MDALRELLTQDAPHVTLDVAALDLAKFEHPGLDPSPWLRELDHIAFGLAERTRDLDDGAGFLRSMNEYLFDELRFHGNVTDYYDPRNSCLNDVLAFRTGLPISLSVVYLEVARRLAKPVYGIGAQGHFLVQFDDGRVAAYIDPFNRGRVMTREQCLQMVSEYTRSPVDQAALPRVPARQIVVRMLRNLESAYLRLNNFEKAVAVADLLTLGGEARGIPQRPSTAN